MARCNGFGRRIFPGFSAAVEYLFQLLGADSPLPVFVLANNTSNAFSLRPLPVSTPGLFTACLTGTWDLETLLHTQIMPASPYLDLKSFRHKYPMLGHSILTRI